MLASFSVAPLGVEGGVSRMVAEILELVERSGLDYRVGAMQTTVEGDPEKVWALLMECHDHMRALAPRVFTHIAIDDRPGASGRLEGKVQSVERVLGHSLKHE